MLSVSQKQELNEDTGAQCMGWGRVRHSGCPRVTGSQEGWSNKGRWQQSSKQGLVLGRWKFFSEQLKKTQKSFSSTGVSIPIPFADKNAILSGEGTCSQ